jgi:hypothetical protein
MRYTTIAALLLGLLAAVGFGCVSAPVVQCPEEFLQKPPITLECRDRWASVRYMETASERLSRRLDGWRTYPGRLDLSVAFAGDAQIESVCVRQTRGEIVEQRAPSAVRALRGVTGAPACFANRRIEIEWSSALITEEEMRVALKQCGAARSLSRPCAPPCGVDARARLVDADPQVFSCLLEILPLALTPEASDELVTFLPISSRYASSEQSFAATEACDGMPSRSELVACMDERGWQEVDWETHRHSLVE